MKYRCIINLDRFPEIIDDTWLIIHSPEYIIIYADSNYLDNGPRLLDVYDREEYVRTLGDCDPRAQYEFIGE